MPSVSSARRVRGRRVGDPRGLIASPDRSAVARLLARRGPIYGDAAAGLLKWPLEKWWAAVGSCEEWFEVTGRGYVLTASGRAALLGNKPKGRG